MHSQVSVTSSSLEHFCSSSVKGHRDDNPTWMPAPSLAAVREQESFPEACFIYTFLIDWRHATLCFEGKACDSSLELSIAGANEHNTVLPSCRQKEIYEKRRQRSKARAHPTVLQALVPHAASGRRRPEGGVRAASRVLRRPLAARLLQRSRGRAPPHAVAGLHRSAGARGAAAGWNKGVGPARLPGRSGCAEGVWAPAAAAGGVSPNCRRSVERERHSLAAAARPSLHGSSVREERARVRRCPEAAAAAAAPAAPAGMHSARR